MKYPLLILNLFISFSLLSQVWQCDEGMQMIITSDTTFQDSVSLYCDIEEWVWDTGYNSYSWEIIDPQFGDTTMGGMQGITCYPQGNILIVNLYLVHFDQWEGTFINCNQTDTIYWSNDSWSFTLQTELQPYQTFYETTSSVQEVEYNSFKNNFYDLSGRRYNSYESIPLGQSYIWNRKVYVKTSYTHNP